MEAEGEAQIEGAKRLRIEDTAQDKNGGGSSMSPSLEIFSKIDSYR